MLFFRIVRSTLSKAGLIHADLRRFAKGEKIEMTVPIHLTGHAVGLKDEGAVLTQAMREIKVFANRQTRLIRSTSMFRIWRPDTRSMFPT